MLIEEEMMVMVMVMVMMRNKFEASEADRQAGFILIHCVLLVCQFYFDLLIEVHHSSFLFMLST